MLKKILAVFFLVSVYSLYAEETPRIETITDVKDLCTLIGISVRDMITRFGAPDSVYAVRGAAEWQDDVVFEYKNVDFYCYKDRVWQISVQTANGIHIGDAKMAVTMVHGSDTKGNNKRISAAVSGYPMPLAYSYLIDTHGRVSAIYLSRTDY